LDQPDEMLYYNSNKFVLLAGIFMTHHHHDGASHPSPAPAPSLLRLSAPRRLAVAGVLIALIWAGFLWATR
jgi:hypothetical protein